MIEYYLNGERIFMEDSSINEPNPPECAGCMRETIKACKEKQRIAVRKEALIDKLRHMYKVLAPFVDDGVKGTITLERRDIELLIDVLEGRK